MVLYPEKCGHRLISLNVNGLGLEVKRREIFRYIKTYKSDIIFLQETYASKEVERIWTNEWGSKIYFNHGTTNSRGVAIALARNFQGKVQGYWSDKTGRFLALLCEIIDKKVLFVNLYAPNEDQPEFFSNVFGFLDNDNLEFDECILGGDFNTTLCPLLDRKTDNPIDPHVKKRAIVLEFMEQANLSDVWRDLHPGVFQFSFRRLEPKITMSRLDYFLIPNGLLDYVTKCELIPRYMTDHSMLLLDIDFCDTPRGPGYWKFNSTLLKDKDFLDTMNKIIDELFDNIEKSKQKHTPDIIWEALKVNIVAYAKEFAIKKAKGKNQLMALLQHKLQKLDQKLVLGQNTEETKKAIKKTEEFLQDEFEKVTLGAIFRSKTEFYELGQKPTKYFFNLERSKSKLAMCLN